MGKVLFSVKDKPYTRHGQTGIYQMYEPAPGSCAGCPLAGHCLPNTKNPLADPIRRLSRDEHESARERMAARLLTPEGKAQYKRRAPTSETPFAFLKQQMNFRRFLLRGIEKVVQEFRWAATSYNILKIIRFRKAMAT